MEVPEDFIAFQRAELHKMLAFARDAETFPWANSTKSALAEMRFDGLAHWLPAEEAQMLRDAYAKELDRLYALEDAK
ncbi:MAG: hypothetical protein ACK5X9_10350 [Alphaproteobacteria bacterium]|jgi:hypothetical protein